MSTKLLGQGYRTVLPSSLYGHHCPWSQQGHRGGGKDTWGVGQLHTLSWRVKRNQGLPRGALVKKRPALSRLASLLHTELRVGSPDSPGLWPAPLPCRPPPHTSSSRSRCRSSWQALSSTPLSSPDVGLRFPVPPDGWSMALGVRLCEQGLAGRLLPGRREISKKRRQEEGDTTL